MKLWLSKLVVCAAACVAALGTTTPAVAVEMFWTQSSSIWYSQLDGSGAQQLIGGVWPSNDLRIDAANAKLYWADTPTAFGKVMRANIDGSQIETVYSSPGDREVLNIALDATNQQVYMAQPSVDAVARVGTDGTGYTPLVSTPNANGLEIDPLAGHLYWTERFGRSILRANLDGTGVQTVYAAYLHAGGVDPWSIDIDPLADKMYFTGSDPADNSFHIQSVNLDGTGFQELLTLSGAPWSLRLGPGGNKLYWAEGNSVYRVNTDGSGLELVLTAPEPVRGIAFGTIPEPTGLALLAAGGLILGRRRG